MYPDDGVNNICNCCDPVESNIEGGLVKGNGQANYIYNTLEDKDSELAQYFEAIEDMDGEDYPDFPDMQEDANKGKLIIGVYHSNSGSGHVVLMMPEEMYSGKVGSIELNETDPLTGQNLEIDRPISLECGGSNNVIEPSNYDTEGLLANFKWYKYVGD